MQPPLGPRTPKPRYGEIFLAVRPALDSDLRLAWSILKGLGASVMLVALVFVIVGAGGF